LENIFAKPHKAKDLEFCKRLIKLQEGD